MSEVYTFHQGSIADDYLSTGGRYVKKPYPVRAVRILGEFEVRTLEGVMRGKGGDYLVEGIRGELYPCDRTIFEESYVLQKP